ncbi:MAG: ABC transporter ATP-binding protein [Armatimonadetes bacterium]|nr:ABC transporter ATP-binding protein [Armatimonadota bacterium]
MSEPAVIAEGLVRRFGAFTAVDHLSFEIPRGRIFGFLGPNGSGKSTTIRMLCGLLLPTEGDARVCGASVRCEPERVRGQIGYMSQQFSLYPDLTVSENLEFYGGVYGITGPRLGRRQDELLDRLELGRERGRLAAELSTGVRQRLALACALIHEPPVLFLDEPTSGVDPGARRRFFELIQDLSAQGVTTLVTTHVMDEAEHCNRLLLIHRGRRVAEGSPAAVKALVPGRLMQVRAEPAMRAADVLEAAPEVLEVSLFGTALHVRLREDIPEPDAFVRTRLLAAGLEVGQIEAARPTLEHAFLALAADSEAEAPS